MNARALSAEFLGTFALVFFGPGAAVVQAQTGALGHAGVAIVFGLAVASIVTVLGPISGAHINPVATLTMWLAGRFVAQDVPAYVVAQLLGGTLAAFVLRIMFGLEGNLGATIPRGSLEQAFMLEVILTFWLMLIALRVSGAGAGAFIGAVVGLEAMMGGPITGASMNPARSFGPALGRAESGRHTGCTGLHRCWVRCWRLSSTSGLKPRTNRFYRTSYHARVTITFAWSSS